MKVLQFPLAKITIWFVAGILFAFYANPAASFVFPLLAIFALFLTVSFYFSKKNLLQKMHFGLLAYGVSFLIGASTLIVHSGDFQQSNYIHHADNPEKQHQLEVVLRERLKSSAYNQRYFANVKRIDQKPCTGKILVNLHKDEFGGMFPIGTNLQLTAIILKHKKPNNPDQFDYGNYLKNKSVLAQVFVGATDVKVGKILDKDIFYYSDLLRCKILQNLEKGQFRQTELNVAAALILGQQQDMNPEILQDYQFAGAIHILSVSGLHIGFILMFLTFLLNFLHKNKWTSYIKLFTIILGLWGFAVLAGLSPSVIRSVTMFSFVAVGMHLKRKTNIFHTLLVSILLILLFEPSFLFDVGFQLSYIALFFILWLQPMLAKIWQPRNKIINYFWQILTVSFAAQIGTLPLSIYYFHQFPGLFFVTNLIIIPFLSIIMALGVVVMVLATFGLTPVLLVKTLELSIFALNKIIAGVASFDQFIIQDISFNQYMMLTLYLLIVASVIWLKKPNFRKMAFAFVSLIVFQLACFGTISANRQQKEWVVFDVKKSTLIAEKSGFKITIFSNENIEKNKMLKTYAVANFSKITKQQPVQNVAFFNGKKILIIDSSGVYSTKINPDILLIRQSPKMNLERLLQDYRPKIIIADGSNYKSYVKLWQQTCEKQNLPFHATAEMGYFRI
ncbi:MAG TPA: ComEC/Rec2 family competence protein [Flavobacterium sp.]|nr:ComEC/Rec2 family competence protein [Flavobacterium sp.]